MRTSLDFEFSNLKFRPRALEWLETFENISREANTEKFQTSQTLDMSLPFKSLWRKWMNSYLEEEEKTYFSVSTWYESDLHCQKMNYICILVLIFKSGNLKRDYLFVVLFVFDNISARLHPVYQIAEYDKKKIDLPQMSRKRI